jgi:single-strand DNA-binding protein
MPALNRVQVIGYLGKDPETKFTPSGKKVCNFSVAVSRKWKSADGEQKEATDWFNIEAWDRLGEICQQFLAKGRLVFLEGRLHTDRVEDKEKGEVRYYTKVVINQMQILDRRSGELEEALEAGAADEAISNE